jgi:hypothetical protein
MATRISSALRSPKRATPAERAVEFKAEQVQLKEDAARRRAVAAAQSAKKPAR